jgi:steroid 5-alpha reductase family enzyme
MKSWVSFKQYILAQRFLHIFIKKKKNETTDWSYMPNKFTTTCAINTSFESCSWWGILLIRHKIHVKFPISCQSRYYNLCPWKKWSLECFQYYYYLQTILEYIYSMILHIGDMAHGEAYSIQHYVIVCYFFHKPYFFFCTKQKSEYLLT